MSTETALRSRRALLFGAAGGIAAALTATMGGAQRVLAAGDDGETVVVGGTFDDARSTTSLLNKGNSRDVLSAASGNAGTGVHGGSFDGYGVAGVSVATGVIGYSGPTTSMPAARQQTGVVGVGSHAAGRGGVFGGEAAQLRMLPSDRPSHPASGKSGDFFFDKNKRLWFCKGGTTWVRLDT